MFKKIIFTAFFAMSLIHEANAVMTINVQFSEQGSWYAKALNSGPDLPEEACSWACEDSMALKSKTGLDFFLNKLPEDSPKLKELKLWAHVRGNDLKIPEDEKAQLQESAKIIESYLQKHVALFESIKKFWEITKTAPINVFISKTNDKQNRGGGFTINFPDGSEVYSTIVFTCLPVFGEKIPIEDYLGVIAHEFSHSMFAAHNEACVSAKLKTLESRITELPSKNATVASWCLDETMAVVLGNGIFCEKLSGKRPEFKGSVSCEPAGLAVAVYDLVLKYFDSSKSIDDDFLKEFLRIFDGLYPKAYIDPNVCLTHVSLIIPNNLNEHEVFSDISQQFHPFDVCCEKFDELNKEKLNEISQSDSTLLIVFEDESQLEKIAHFIPTFDKAKPINMVHENKRTYIFLKTDKDHPFQERLKELITVKF